MLLGPFELVGPYELAGPFELVGPSELVIRIACIDDMRSMSFE